MWDGNLSPSLRSKECLCARCSDFHDMYCTLYFAAYISCQRWFLSMRCYANVQRRRRLRTAIQSSVPVHKIEWYCMPRQNVKLKPMKLTLPCYLLFFKTPGTLESSCCSLLKSIFKGTCLKQRGLSSWMVGWKVREHSLIMCYSLAYQFGIWKAWRQVSAAG